MKVNVILLLTILSRKHNASLGRPSSLESPPSRSLSPPNQDNLSKQRRKDRILVAGSLNLDTFLPISRLPVEGETLTLVPGEVPNVDVPGGKGCNQAVACARFLPLRETSDQSPSDKEKVTEEDDNVDIDDTHLTISFLGRFGSDPSASILKNALISNGVDTSSCSTCTEDENGNSIPSGRGYVLLQRASGKVSAVVSGGSNTMGWKDFETAYQRSQMKGETDSHERQNDTDDLMVDEDYLDSLLGLKSDGMNFKGKVKCILLQREVPEYVNLILARHAKKRSGIIVIQDVGGEDRSISREMLQLIDYIVPNESELQRLVTSLGWEEEKGFGWSSPSSVSSFIPDEGVSENLQKLLGEVVSQARFLQSKGANNVLVTLGAEGSILIDTQCELQYQPPCILPTGCEVVDETGAGDCYRAGFAVALTAGNEDRLECMKFASAAGALAVTKEGAVPSIPTYKEVKALMESSFANKSDPFQQSLLQRGGALDQDEEKVHDNDDDFPIMFGSRLNSMKDRPELWDASVKSDVREWVKRQGTIKGLGCVDFNYPQHFHDWTADEAKEALEEAGLIAGAVCLRYPSKFARGAMNHPDEEMRREAIEITKSAAEYAKQLGCNEVVVWSAYDGYDYPFQVNYDDKWNQIVEAFRECCDAHPDIKWSLEYKPTDENTRFFTVPSTGAAILLVKEIDRPNMGLTLDVGHMLMAGENPGQSIAMVGGEKLFGIQLNDGYTRLAAEDGMMFGSVHPSQALEVIFQLRRVGFKGHFYFDTFPQRTDPVMEAEYNICRVKEFWHAAGKINTMNVNDIMNNHDAIGALKIVEEVLRKT